MNDAKSMARDFNSQKNTFFFFFEGSYFSQEKFEGKKKLIKELRPSIMIGKKYDQTRIIKQEFNNMAKPLI